MLFEFLQVSIKLFFPSLLFEENLVWHYCLQVALKTLKIKVFRVENLCFVPLTLTADPSG
jgi:hypothetical protein